jgi:hypothetical protein
MFQNREHRLKPFLIIALVSATLPAAALAQERLASDGASVEPRSGLRSVPVPSTWAMLDLRHSLRLAYEERTLERELRLTAGEIEEPIRHVLSRASTQAVIATPAVVATPAFRATASWTADWYAIAQCESGGRWDYSGPSGFWGGLQFAPSTWFAFGGGPYDGVGPFPYSPAEQIAVAERVLAVQGPGAWPNCFRWG